MNSAHSCSFKITGVDWEALCPELFGLILKFVQQNAEEEGEARRVVALAGVCRRWRQLIQQSYTSPVAEIGLLQFPFALKQPGPCNRPVQCLLKRKGNFLALFQDAGRSGEKLDFLMAARREWKPSCLSYVISASHNCFSRSGHAYMGKLKSDFWASHFLLWEVRGNGERSKKLVSRIGYSERTVSGFRQRVVSCELFLGNKNALLEPLPLSKNSRQDFIDNSLKFLHLRWNCFTPPPKSRPPVTTFLRSYSSLRRSGKYLDRNNSKVGVPSSIVHNNSTRLREDSTNSVAMESKAPEWDNQRQCWSLDFHGRSTLPSNYSFQLVSSQPQEASMDQSNTGESHSQEQTIFLQLGKVGKGLYTVDFCHPLSAFQAFAICISSFATSVGLEP